MTAKPEQELLPPVSEGPEKFSGLFEWLTDPLPGRFVLPATGLLVLGLDWLLFSQEAASLGLLTPVTGAIGFVVGGLGTFHLQRKFARDSRSVAGLKALMAAVLVGLPFPITGTLVGGWILATSGLMALRNRLFAAGILARR